MEPNATQFRLFTLRTRGEGVFFDRSEFGAGRLARVGQTTLAPRLFYFAQARACTTSGLTYVELAPVFRGDRQGLDEFLQKPEFNGPSLEPWRTPTPLARRHNYVKQKRQGTIPKHPIADFALCCSAAGQNKRGMKAIC